MSFRRNLLTGEPIVFSPERAARPRAFLDDATALTCPFCPGHEHETPPSLAVAGEPWRVRVFANKYPSVTGAEVIVEAAEHEARFEDVDHAADVVAMYVERYRAHSDAAYVSLFKNEGAAAGSSIPHLHSQVMPLPFVPPRVTRELAGFRDACPLCARPGEVIVETEHFTWLAPHASWMPYQQWLVPKRHACEMTALDGAALAELASLLRASAGKMRTLAPAFNWMFLNFPREPQAHWYVDLFPRMTTIAGFELGTGTFVEIIDPAAAARQFRS
ncbi:MAG: UDPglucose--hexose-phosphate uridylyltransferase [Acidobacteriota bacterium]|nr:UDPglucose--hexose-phosphate uridylyltransferase [Acidobacteriota bacterium]